MSVLVHLSDLHFGRVDERLLEPLATAVDAAAPQVVVVSGDLTQRARRAEFEAARDFLGRLPRPRVVVPGNHDVPLYNVIDRLVRPLARFRQFIEADPFPSYVDERVAVIGVNTTRSNVAKNGRINEAQIEALRQAFAPLPAHVARVVVTHHPFDAGDGLDEGDRVGRAAQALRMFAQCGVDLLLSGHLHLASSGESARSAAVQGAGALLVSAGTATSTRVRGEPNEFNVLRVAKEQVVVQRQAWAPDRAAFVQGEVSVFRREGQRWQRV